MRFTCGSIYFKGEIFSSKISKYFHEINPAEVSNLLFLSKIVFSLTLTAQLCFPVLILGLSPLLSLFNCKTFRLIRENIFHIKL